MNAIEKTWQEWCEERTVAAENHVITIAASTKINDEQEVRFIDVRIALQEIVVNYI